MKTQALLWAVFLSSSVQAADEHGRFSTGGGAGAVSCPEFLDGMATARQIGGLKSTNGVSEIEPFVNYALGFQTAFNMTVPGVVDVFAKIKGINILLAIEPWCKNHPDKLFSDGVIELALKLVPNRTK